MKAEHSQLIPQKLTENLEVLTALNPIGIITMSLQSWLNALSGNCSMKLKMLPTQKDMSKQSK